MMELRRTAEALLRKQTTLPFLMPAFTRQHISLPTRQASFTRQTRCLSTTKCLRRADGDRPSPTPAPARDNAPKPRDDFSKFLDSSLDFTKGTSTTNTQRTSRFKSSSAQQDHRLQPADSPSGGRNDSMSDMMKAFDEATVPNSTRSSTNRSSSTSRYSPNSQPSKMDVSKMIDPRGHTKPTEPKAAPKPLEVKLGPTLGRTIRVDQQSADIGRALRTLEILCSRNRVRADVFRQRFHERGGLKRKRLKMERWRKHFKDGFRGMVKAVNKMKKKGW